MSTWFTVLVQCAVYVSLCGLMFIPLKDTADRVWACLIVTAVWAPFMVVGWWLHGFARFYAWVHGWNT